MLRGEHTPQTRIINELLKTNNFLRSNYIHLERSSLVHYTGNEFYIIMSVVVKIKFEVLHGWIRLKNTPNKIQVSSFCQIITYQFEHQLHKYFHGQNITIIHIKFTLFFFLLSINILYFFKMHRYDRIINMFW